MQQLVFSSLIGSHGRRGYKLTKMSDILTYHGIHDCIINRDTPFARFCFPQKFFEMLACELPIAVASTGDVKDLMKQCPHALFQPENDTELLSAIRKQLAAPCRPRVKVATWEQQGAVLEEFLKLCSGTG